MSSGSASVTSKTALLLSPFSTTSQVTLPANPIAQPAESTVRLVSDQERFVIRRQGSGSSESDSNSLGSPTSGSGDDSFGSESGDEKSQPAAQARPSQLRGRSRTPISDVLSAYYQDSLHDGRNKRGMVDSPDFDWRDRDSPSPSQYSVRSGKSEDAEPQPDMSWFLTLLLLSCVTVVSAPTVLP